MIYWKGGVVKRWWRSTSNENGNYEIGWECYPTFWNILFFQKAEINEFELRGSTWYDKKTGKYTHQDVAKLLDLNKTLYSLLYDDYV